MTKQQQIFDVIRRKVIGVDDRLAISVHYVDSDGVYCIEYFEGLTDQELIFVLIALLTTDIDVKRVDYNTTGRLKAPLKS